MNGYGIGLTQFLYNHPGMDVCPTLESGLRIEGTFSFSAEWKGYGRLTDAFRIRITVPALFPRAVPIVHELDGRIPRTKQYHVNQTDHSLCLGSPLRLLRVLTAFPTFDGFSERCLIPYLYAVSRKLQWGGDFIFGELAHGQPGEVADYMEMFGLKNEFQIMYAIRCLGMKKRIANKLACPCNCGRCLGACRFNQRLRKFRFVAARCWYRMLLSQLLDGKKAEGVYII